MTTDGGGIPPMSRPQPAGSSQLAARLPDGGPAPPLRSAHAPSDSPRAVAPVGPAQEGERLALDARAMLREAARLRHPDREVRVLMVPDQTTDRVVVRVEDRQSGELVAQYPPEDLLRFYAAARAGDRGPIIDLTT